MMVCASANTAGRQCATSGGPPCVSSTPSAGIDRFGLDQADIEIEMPCAIGAHIDGQRQRMPERWRVVRSAARRMVAAVAPAETGRQRAQ